MTKIEDIMDSEILPKPKVRLDGEKMRNGLAQLVLTVVELLRELLEKQALRRIEHGALDDDQVERLGSTFMALKQEVEKLKDYFKLTDEDLNLDLGPISLREEGIKGQASAVELLEARLQLSGDSVVMAMEGDGTDRAVTGMDRGKLIEAKFRFTIMDGDRQDRVTITVAPPCVADAVKKRQADILSDYFRKKGIMLR